MTATALKIRPALSETVRRFLHDKALILSLTEALGSPLNILFPQTVTSNLASFKDVYRDLGLTGKVFFTHKPNKSLSLIRQAALSDAHLDVSSAGELAHGLKAGFHPDRMEATGPKNDEYLLLCLLHGIMINIDSLPELQRLIILKSSLPPRRLPIMLRLMLDRDQKTRFTRTDSTFGMDRNDAIEALTLIQQNNFDFIGFSFHLGSHSQQMWPDMFAHAWQMTQYAFEQGLMPQAINIGGGYPIRLAQCEVEWNAYVEALKSSVLNNEQPLSWNDSGLGYSRSDGKLKGSARFPDHIPSVSGAAALKQLLKQPITKLKGMTSAQLLSESAIDLYIEPGRALHDQAGITLARVMETRLSANGEQLVRLEMNRTNINAAEIPLMTDPVIIYRNLAREPAPHGVFYVGNLCRHHDMIQYHRTFPAALPETGDIVAFINTAPYMMDFAESNLLHQPVADKIAVVETANGFHWQRDELYNPLRSAT